LRRYVYYRVRLHDAAAAVAAVRAMHARWSAAGVTCELLRRAGQTDGVTLMETYRDAPPATLAAIEAEAHAALSPWLVGERHTEDFDLCA
jgi:Domain of unknown function (DUF4936)